MAELDYGTFYDPYSEMHPVYKVKLFFDKEDGTRAEQLFGEWLEEHPHVTISDFRYEQSGSCERSIYITYKEEK